MNRLSGPSCFLPRVRDGLLLCMNAVGYCLCCRCGSRRNMWLVGLICFSAVVLGACSSDAESADSTALTVPKG